jgi:predicted porin
LFGELRWNNSISYNSPKFSGVDFNVIYSFGEKVNSGDKTATGYPCLDNNGAPTAATTCKGADTSDAGKLGIGVRYANGPVYLTAIYEARTDNDSMLRPATPTLVQPYYGYGAKAWAIGGAYDFKVVKLFANYFREKANHNGRADYRPEYGADKQSVWSVGLTVPVSGVGTVFAEYAQYKDYLNGGIRGASLAAPTMHVAFDVNAGHKSKGFMLGYRHNLSRRTFVYTYATQFKNDRGITGGFTSANGAPAAAGGNGTDVGVAGKTQNIFVAGIVHSF